MFTKSGFDRSGTPRRRWKCVECESLERQDRLARQIDGMDVEAEWLEEADRIRPKTCSGDCPSMREFGKCIHITCRYHLISVVTHDRLNGAVRIDDTVDFLVDMPFTCLWELMEKEKRPLTLEEISCILGTERQRIHQIEQEGLRVMKRNAKHLEFLLEDEVDPRYIKPFPCLGDAARISDMPIMTFGFPHGKKKG